MNCNKNNGENNSILKISTKKERFETVTAEISVVRNALRTANTEEAVTSALDNLATLVYRISREEEVKGLALDIAGMIHAVKMHDAIRSSLDDILEKLLERVKDIIMEEQKQENVSKLKTLFLELAENAEALAEIVDIGKIFG